MKVEKEEKKTLEQEAQELEQQIEQTKVTLFRLEGALIYVNSKIKEQKDS